MDCIIFKKTGLILLCLRVIIKQNVIKEDRYMSIPYYEQFEKGIEYKYDFAASFYNGDSGFPSHLHRFYEMIVSFNDGTIVKIDGIPYKMNKNDVILIKPYQIHEITNAASRFVYLFSPDLIPAISDDFINHELTSPLVSYKGDFPEFLMIDLENASNILEKKGVLYLLCSCFFQNIDFNSKTKKTKDKILLQKVFDFIDDNVSKACRIDDLSAALKRAPSYLSRVFSSNVGIPYGEYVRRIKINRACNFLENTDDTVIEITGKCGYDSLTSFNRAFKSVTGVTPTDYRREKYKK